MSHSVCMPVAVASADLLTAAFTGFQKSSTCMLCVNSPIQKMASRQRASSSFDFYEFAHQRKPPASPPGVFLYALLEFNFHRARSTPIHLSGAKPFLLWHESPLHNSLEISWPRHYTAAALGLRGSSRKLCDALF